MEVTTLGIDLGKNVFHVVGLDARGRVAIRRRVSRSQRMVFTGNLPACLDRTRREWRRQVGRGTMRFVSPKTIPQLDPAGVTSCPRSPGRASDAGGEPESGVPAGARHPGSAWPDRDARRDPTASRIERSPGLSLLAETSGAPIRGVASSPRENRPCHPRHRYARDRRSGL